MTTPNPEYILVESLRYALADETGNFLTYTQLSLKLGMGDGWTSNLIRKSSAIKETTIPR